MLLLLLPRNYACMLRCITYFVFSKRTHLDSTRAEEPSRDPVEL